MTRLNHLLMRRIRSVTLAMTGMALLAAPILPVYANGNQAIVQLYQKINQLQQEVRDLRGQNQELSHQISDLRKRQRKLYMNTDQRLQALEAAVSGGAQVQHAAGSGLGSSGTVSAPNADAQPGQGMAPTATTAGAPATPMPAASSAATANNGFDAYQQAFNLLKNSHYHESVDAFKLFIQNYPQSPYVPNAEYWMGEALYVEQHFNQALAQYQKVVNQYPQSNKVSASLLKIGYSQYELKQWSAARKTLEGVISNYPGTTPARLAAGRLKQMQSEGH